MNTKINNSFLFTALTAIFITCLIAANIIAGKLWLAPFGIVLTTGVFCFPLVYIIGDVLPEVYGLKKAQQVIWIGFVANALAVAFFYLSLSAPFPVFWTGQEAFATVLGFTPRLLMASFCGYLIGTNVNAWVLVQVKALTGGRWLWLRTISSTIVGESIDSAIFIALAFWGILPTAAIGSMIIAQAVFKTAYEVLATPLTYVVVAWVKRAELSEVTDAVR